VSSDEPSIVPRIARDAPREEVINRGKPPRTISVEKSVKKLTRPRAATLHIPSPFESIGLSRLVLWSLLEKSKSELPYTHAKD
jgi:hypothetical protein